MSRPTIRDVARHAGVSLKTVSRVINGEASVRDDTRERVQRAGCVAVDVKHTLLSRERVAELHAAGLRICAWTVNDPARAADLLAWGVDTVITDAVDVIPPDKPASEV